jgi:hypothetical protein
MSVAPALSPPPAAAADWRPRLAEACLVMPAADALHVVTARGSFDVRGRSLDRLHERLAPFLTGDRSESELLAAIPEGQRDAVRTYLARLRAVGALEDAGSRARLLLPRALRKLGARRPRVSLRIPGARVDVSLDGLPGGGSRPGIALGFVSASAAGELLVRAGLPGWRARRVTCVVAGDASSVTDEELERRAGYARWLLGSGDALGDSHALNVYTLDPDAGTLHRTLSLDPAIPAEMADLPDRLGLLRAADVDQVPLVVATASHRFFPHSVAAFGLELPAVRAHLLRAFLLPLLLPSRHPADASGLRTGTAGAALRTFAPSNSWAGWNPALTTAASLDGLHLMLLEEHAAARAADDPPEWRDVDLLAGDGEHPALDYLRGVLRLRHRELPGRIATTPDGLTLCSAAGAEARSFLPARARAQVLLAAAWREFYGSGHVGDALAAAAPVCEPEAFASPAALRRVVRRAASALGGDAGVPIGVRRLRCWGVTFWAGALMPVAGGRVR